MVTTCVYSKFKVHTKKLTFNIRLQVCFLVYETHPPPAIMGETKPHVMYIVQVSFQTVVEASGNETVYISS